MSKTGSVNEKFKVIKDGEEVLQSGQLEKVEGGGTECTCDCWIANSNKDKEDLSKPKPDLGGATTDDPKIQP